MVSNLRYDDTTCFCVYGGFQFPSPVHTTVTCTPRYDPSDRSITSRKYLIHLETTLVSQDFSLLSGVSIEAKMEALRVLLTTEGLALEFNSFGYGDMSISRTTNLDVNYGPKPRLLNMKVMAPTNAIFVAWEVEIVLWEGSCTLSGKGFPSDFEYFVYTVNISMDESLMRSRTINIEAMTLASRTPLPNVDDTTPRTKIQQNAGSQAILQEILSAFPTLQGFRRSVNDNISNDLQKVQLSITDTEIDTPNPYYAGCSHIDVRHRTSIDFPLASATSPVQVVNMMSGTIRTNPGQSKGLALKAFITILLNRLQAALAGAKQTSGSVTPMSPIINHLEFEESIYSRESSFSASWFYTTTLANLLSDSGLWSPVTDPPGLAVGEPIILRTNLNAGQMDWTKWQAALDASAQRIFDLSVEDSDVTLTNYCNPFNAWKENKTLDASLKNNSSDFPSTNDLKKPTTSTTQNKSTTAKTPSQKVSIPTQLGTIGGDAPPAESSWVRFQVKAQRYAVPNMVRVPLLDTPPADTKALTIDNPALGLINVSKNNASPDRIEIRSTGLLHNYIIVSGYAIRFGTPIVIPTVTKIGDQTNPTIAHKIAEENRVIANIFGVPLYYSSWKHSYFGFKEQEDVTLNLQGAPYAVQGKQPTSNSGSPSEKTITIKAI